VQCLTASDCGTSTTCRQATCTAGVCGHVDAPSSTVCFNGVTLSTCNGAGTCV
jgi:hypothetical protein